VRGVGGLGKGDLTGSRERMKGSRKKLDKKENIFRKPFKIYRFMKSVYIFWVFK